ncbi:hypothetical protein [Chroococcidiopsis cubana]|uniref:hypothetical protein n=1 Tax=Chroococcidiopsis cubana TaxID=171392 RepID=UPI0015E6F5D8|nr:hypothetical protein [Chroococcidiopsis cubana]
MTISSHQVAIADRISPARSSLRLLFQKPLCVFARQLLQRGKPPQRTGSSLRDPKSYFVKL